MNMNEKKLRMVIEEGDRLFGPGKGRKLVTEIGPIIDLTDTIRRLKDLIESFKNQPQIVEGLILAYTEIKPLLKTALNLSNIDPMSKMMFEKSLSDISDSPANMPVEEVLDIYRKDPSDDCSVCPARFVCPNAKY